MTQQRLLAFLALCLVLLVGRPAFADEPAGERLQVLLSG